MTLTPFDSRLANPDTISAASSPFVEPSNRSRMLAAGLRAMAEASLRRCEAAAVRQWSERLDRGESPLAAGASLVRSLPPVLRVLLTTAGDIERIESVLPRAVEQIVRSRELRTDVGVRLLRPFGYMAGALAMALLACLATAPMIANIYADQLLFDDRRLLDDRMTMWFFVGLARYPLIMTVGILLSIATVVFVVICADRFCSSTRWRFESRTAPFGPKPELRMSEFVASLAVFIEGGMSLVIAVRRAAEITDDNRRFRQFAAAIETGETADHAAAMTGMPWPVGNALSMMAPPSVLAEALRKLADLHGLHAEETAQRASMILTLMTVGLSALLLFSLPVAILDSWLF